MSNSQKSNLVVYILIIIIIVGIICAEHLIGLPEAGVALKGQLNSVQSKMIDLIKDMTKTLVDWAFALIGGYAYFYKKHLENISKRNFSILLFIVGVSSCVISLYNGYLVVEGIAMSLSHDILNIRDQSIAYPGLLQFVFLAVAVVLFTFYVTNSANQEDGGSK